MQDTQEMYLQSLSWEHPPKEEMATHSSILAWKILWTEEPGGLQSMDSDTTEQVYTHALHLGRLTSCFVMQQVSFCPIVTG